MEKTDLELLATDLNIPRTHFPYLFQLLLDEQREEEQWTLSHPILTSLKAILSSPICPGPICLYLGKIAFTLSQFKDVVQALLESPNSEPKELNLAGDVDNSIVFQPEEVMAEVLKEIADILISEKLPPNFTLDLRSTGLNSRSIAIFTEKLRHAFSLPTGLNLFLSDNDLEDEGMLFLSKALKKMNDASEFLLDLSMNTIGDQGAFYLAEIFKKINFTNFNLSLSENEIGAKGFKIILNAIKMNNKLSSFTLDLRENLPPDSANNEEILFNQVIKDYIEFLTANPNLIIFSDRIPSSLAEQNEFFSKMGELEEKEFEEAAGELISIIEKYPPGLLNFTQWLIHHVKLDGLQGHKLAMMINKIVNELRLSAQVREKLYELTRNTWLAQDSLNKYETVISQWLADSNFRIYCRNLIDGSFNLLARDEEECENFNTIGIEIRSFIGSIINFNKELATPVICQPLIDSLLPFSYPHPSVPLLDATLIPEIANHYVKELKNFSEELSKLVPREGNWPQAINQLEASTSFTSSNVAHTVWQQADDDLNRKRLESNPLSLPRP